MSLNAFLPLTKILAFGILRLVLASGYCMGLQRLLLVSLTLAESVNLWYCLHLCANAQWKPHNEGHLFCVL
uniref:Uncharacterized protein n=1 Tax=Lepeophtheirus salmonis TaxID=72036 RepID=A0A0K2THZ9_LEPSM